MVKGRGREARANRIGNGLGQHMAAQRFTSSIWRSKRQRSWPEGGMWSLGFSRSGHWRDGRLKAEIPVAGSEANSCQCMQTLVR